MLQEQCAIHGLNILTKDSQQAFVFLIIDRYLHIVNLNNGYLQFFFEE